MASNNGLFALGGLVLAAIAYAVSKSGGTSSVSSASNPSTGDKPSPAPAPGAKPGGGLAPPPSFAPGSYDFAFNDDRWLKPGQSKGGRAYVPAGLSGQAPLLIWLHGNNDGGAMHKNAGGQSFDVRKLAPQSMIVAAPSQTRDAKNLALWAGFDIDAFVDAVEKATGAKVDRSNVILAGHSGAGCNRGAKGGLLSPFKSIKPRVLLAIDTCLDANYGNALGDIASGGVDVRVYYQPGTWKRDFAGFAAAFKKRGVFEELKVPVAGFGNAHEDIVPAAFRKVFSPEAVA